MATISGLTACSGGDHISGTITMSEGGSHPFRVLMSELRAAPEQTNIREFILRQVASLRRQFPNETLVQFRNRVQSYTFLE